MVGMCQVHLPDLLVDDHSNSSLGDIKYPSRLSVVELVWHTFVEGTMALDKRGAST